MKNRRSWGVTAVFLIPTPTYYDPQAKGFPASRPAKLIWMCCGVSGSACAGAQDANSKMQTPRSGRASSLIVGFSVLLVGISGFARCRRPNRYVSNHSSFDFVSERFRPRNQTRLAFCASRAPARNPSMLGASAERRCSVIPAPALVGVPASKGG